MSKWDAFESEGAKAKLDGLSGKVQTVKSPPAMQETWVRSLGWKDPLEKGMTAHSSLLALGIPWTEESGRLHSMSHKESDMTEELSTSLFYLICL